MTKDVEIAEAKERAFPIEYLRSILDYNPETGVLLWKERNVRNALAWKAQRVGRPALSAVAQNGYCIGVIDGVTFRAHRIAYAMHHGIHPKGEIDHINGVRTDNRAENLRLVSSCENKRNQRLSVTNTSDAIGVRYVKEKRAWQAVIQVNKKQHFLGYHACIEDAIAARLAAHQRFGFHPNHGAR